MLSSVRAPVAKWSPLVKRCSFSYLYALLVIFIYARERFIFLQILGEKEVIEKQ